ncbi:MAG: RDD family protein [Candidatus Methylomirabilales bacterium]
MRCPHCGYVSFDRLTACRRCTNPLPQYRRQGPTPPAPRPEAGPPFPVGVEEERARIDEGAPTEGDAFEEELDLSHLTLPTELHAALRPPVVYGGFGRRAVAALIDAPLLLFLTVLAMILAFLTAIGGGTVGGEVTGEVTLLALGVALAAALVVSLAYHVLCWGHGGQTPGMMLLGLQVVREDGEEIGYIRAFLRWVGYLFALLPLGLGMLLVFFQPRRRGLHDLLAGTCVIRVGSASRL